MHKKVTRPTRSKRKLQSLHYAAHYGTHSPVVVHLSNGVRLQGLVLRMDDYVLLLGKHVQDQQPQVVYKHAISWVMPAAAANSPFDAHRDEAINSPEFVDLFIPRGRRRG
ncbi:hypothetical protein BKK79_22700 [Cupriavidus sp. USMAA2-4]|uniref:RNA chaperone Hfq n=1 Tax=unclassified Cupriavidus TaxID=2640874 RepID=UPI0008A6DD64|nr:MULTISPECIES: RNA chaperone Hfq [unclassified Cupriavidus]AOY94711.1 hypothetical protein BKK79_22700 [Cupriavidus sp. USMAA2-4]AOZ02425.1 hypothetical protein BKK81_24545 [Cupriavidus sp. USMAHM13]